MRIAKRRINCFIISKADYSVLMIVSMLKTVLAQPFLISGIA